MPQHYGNNPEQLLQAIAFLNQMLEGGATDVSGGRPQDILRGFQGLVDRGDAPAGSQVGVDSGSGALDRLMEIGGPEVFNLLRKLAAEKKKAEGEGVGSVGIKDLIVAIEQAQAEPAGPKDLGDTRNPNIMRELLRAAQ